MPIRSPRPLTQQRLLTCIVINQLATPGLGSLLARRKVVGTCQLLLALAGFALITLWMVQFFYGIAIGELDGSLPRKSHDWMWSWGIIFFGASWLWAFVTSISLWRQAKTAGRGDSTGIPPRITEPPPSEPGASGRID
jgi:hypothetical protein